MNGNANFWGDFSGAPTEQFGSGELIPDGTLAWAILSFKQGSPPDGITPSKSNPENAYMDLELTICEGPYAKRKVWDMIGVRGAEGYVNNGRAAIRAILETGRGATTANSNAYRIQNLTELAGLKVAIKIRIEKGTGGYSDKNKVAVYLSPNPQSSTFKDWTRLLAGNAAPAAQAPAPQQAQAPAGEARPSWL